MRKINAARAMLNAHNRVIDLEKWTVISVRIMR